MVTKTRCKFQVTQITETAGWNGKRIRLDARYDVHRKPEDASFAMATPSGTMEISVDNQAVIPMLELGREFYVDLIPVSEA